MSTVTKTLPEGAKLTIEFEENGKKIKLTADLHEGQLVMHYKPAPQFTWDNYYMFHSWDPAIAADVSWEPKDGVVYRMAVE